MAVADLPAVELPMLAKTEAPWLRVEELASILIDTPEGRLRDFITLAYYTAGRRGSIERLRKPQVNLKLGRIDLQPVDATVLQQNSKKRRPVVPIFDEIRPTVERLMAEPGEWLLGSPTPMYKAFRKHLTDLGFADRANPHILRHSRATHLLLRGVDIYKVAKLLGDTVGTVERVYGHVCPDALSV
jgi:integrase